MLSELIKGIRSQSRLAISQAISLIENDSIEGPQLLSKIYNYSSNAFRIGITGPPGAGKSSLTDQLISIYRKEGKRIAVIAVDPTSPFSGGAVLGDRIRMTSHYSDSNVFIRSMATRGGHGGLALRTQEVGDVFAAANFDIIIYETVGVGQIELDVIQATDSVVVVLVPESGDEIQIIKAGLMEIGNIFVINKADRPGSGKLMISLKNFISNNLDNDKWNPKVIETIATESKGVIDLVKFINSHKNFNINRGYSGKKDNERYKKNIEKNINDIFIKKFWNKQNINMLTDELKKDSCLRKSPFELANIMLKNVK